MSITLFTNNSANLCHIFYIHSIHSRDLVLGSRVGHSNLCCPVTHTGYMFKMSARLQASADVELNSSIFWVIIRRDVVWNQYFRTNVLVPPSWTSWAFKMGQIGTPETLISNYVTPSNNSEDARIETLERLNFLNSVYFSKHLISFHRKRIKLKII